jgi:lysophospholipase L1-like esterase
MDNGYLQTVPSSERQSDRIHFTAAGHERLAAAILPEALGGAGEVSGAVDPGV